MSLKEKLEKRRKAAADAAAQDERLRKGRLAARERNASALEKHLLDEDLQSIELEMKREHGRLILTHTNFQIAIDAGVQQNQYELSLLLPEKKEFFTLLKTIDKTTAGAFEEVEEFILKAADTRA